MSGLFHFDRYPFKYNMYLHKTKGISEAPENIETKGISEAPENIETKGISEAPENIK
jgi:hypothetical protein